jgi:hypothetical protein
MPKVRLIGGPLDQMVMNVTDEAMQSGSAHFFVFESGNTGTMEVDLADPKFLKFTISDHQYASRYHPSYDLDLLLPHWDHDPLRISQVMRCSGEMTDF